MRFVFFPVLSAPCALAVLLAAAGLPQRADAEAVVHLRVGAGLACNFPTIQEAINAADNANGTTLIHINRTRDGSNPWVNQQLDINGKNVELLGGYDDCSQALPNPGNTVLHGSADATRPILTVRGSTSVVGVQFIDLVENTNNGSIGGAGFGGAMAVRGGPHAQVFLGDVRLGISQARYGGGLYVNNEFSANPADVALILANVMIDGNRGDLGGGGIWCAKAQMLIAMDVAGIIGNQTLGMAPGGGLRAENCNVDIGGGFPGIGTFAFNTAGGDGGGISANGGSLVRLFTFDASVAPGVMQNSAGGRGGGIAIESNSRVQGWETIIEGNTAHAGGGAVSIDETTNDGIDAAFQLRGDLIGAPVTGDGAVPCAPQLRCNRIGSNHAATTGGAPLAGGAILIHSAGDANNTNMAPLVALYGTEVSGNSGTNLVTSSGDGVDLQLHGNALFNNTASDYLIDISAPSAASVDIFASTIAGNSSGGATSRSIQRNTAVALQFKHGIHWQPGKRITSTLGLGANAIDYVLANDANDGSISNHGSTADPQFVNASAQDYRLKLASPAVDYTIAGSEPTANHLPRVVDLAPVANQYGSQDLGAYERQDACGDDTIFCSGFEP